MPGIATLADYLDGSPDCSPDLAAALKAIAAVAGDMSRRIRRGAIEGALGKEVGENLGGDTQKALDVICDDAFAAALAKAPVRWLASEERDSVDELNPAGTLAVAIDPLDGSSNIDLNISIGAIFSVLDAKDDWQGSFLRPGHEQIAAGYAIYGPQTALVLTLGAGTLLFALDPDSGDFIRIGGKLSIAPATSEFAINASNQRHWDAPVKRFIEDCLAGAEGPRGADFNMRWVASLVAETHRILMRGGVFLYPRDDRKGYERGRLRHLYECAPIAFVVEQAGGRATDGLERILDRIPDALHARTPFVFGCAMTVERIADYHVAPDNQTTALFGNRGLFRN